jgi:Domain of unknown function (DUF5753)
MQGLRCAARPDPGPAELARQPAHTAGGAHGEAIPDDSSIYMALEDTAIALIGYAPSQVPPPRTEAYARAVITSTGLGSGEVDRLVCDCMIRRARVTQFPSRPPGPAHPGPPPAGRPHNGEWLIWPGLASTSRETP